MLDAKAGCSTWNGWNDQTQCAGRAMMLFSGGVVDEHPGAAGVLDRVELQLRALADGRDAGIADKRAGAGG